MARRNIWDDEDQLPTLPTASTPPFGDTQIANRDTHPDGQPEKPVAIVDGLRMAKPKQRVRDRSWEKAHPKKTYRKVPHEIRDTVKAIAETWGYNTSQIAQAFLEYALMSYRRGDFTLDLELSANGLTLMPDSWSDGKKPIWAENLSGAKPPPKKKRNKKTEGIPLWMQRVSYVLPADLVTKIDRICETRTNPDGSIISRTYHDGEVVARFLAYSIEAYNSGKLTLQDSENA